MCVHVCLQYRGTNYAAIKAQNVVFSSVRQWFFHYSVMFFFLFFFYTSYSNLHLYTSALLNAPVSISYFIFSPLSFNTYFFPVHLSTFLFLHYHLCPVLCPLTMLKKRHFTFISDLFLHTEETSGLSEMVYCFKFWITAA